MLFFGQYGGKLVSESNTKSILSYKMPKARGYWTHEISMISGSEGPSWNPRSMKNRCQIDAEKGKAPETHFDRFWMNFQNRAKTFKNRCRNAFEN